MHNVKCYYCGQTFDRDKEPFVLVSKRRYAHQKCCDVAEANNSNDNKEALYDYIKNLFGYEIIPEAIDRQIDSYIKKDNYTYAGILRTLQYCYEVKHMSLEKSGGRIGIVAYTYEDSLKYYMHLEAMRKINEKLSQNGCITGTEEIHIEQPTSERKKFHSRLFSFLEG